MTKYYYRTSGSSESQVLDDPLVAIIKLEANGCLDGRFALEHSTKEHICLEFVRKESALIPVAVSAGWVSFWREDR